MIDTHGLFDGIVALGAREWPIRHAKPARSAQVDRIAGLNRGGSAQLFEKWESYLVWFWWEVDSTTRAAPAVRLKG